MAERRVQRRLRDRPASQDDVVEVINRELKPLIAEMRDVLNKPLAHPANIPFDWLGLSPVGANEAYVPVTTQSLARSLRCLFDKDDFAEQDEFSGKTRKVYADFIVASSGNDELVGFRLYNPTHGEVIATWVHAGRKTKGRYTFDITDYLHDGITEYRIDTRTEPGMPGDELGEVYVARLLVRYE